ncbi:hypothetical protein [Massilia pseudoviolaceinigra]|uniref:hypothetical protein n=1 Tax=Massilia pseudoviolaceinigra TaxID=3057165 RepID=UPI002796D6E6|nr:hypothetical protein [Massilia sp. CCM 9206]MDQ1923977.1 hypothetical protein [Massilia sp. CCM 9206]
MNSLRLIWPLLLAAASPALAQTSAAPPAYDSAFAGYRTYQEPKTASWKATLDQLRKAPGHMGHMGHAGHDMSATKQPDAAKVDDPHAGHDMSSMKKSPEPAKAKSDPHHGHHHKE